MQYMGSKNRLSKQLAPIIQSYINEDTKGYLESFVGGANMLDKIIHHNKIGLDINKYLIALLRYAQQNELPITISEEEYKNVKNNKDDYDDWYVGLVGFCGSFGAKWFGGFARRYNKNGSLFDVPQQAINSLRKQSQNDNFKDIKFRCMNFLDIPKDKIKGYVIYCDPPYKNTTKYKGNGFPYEEFYKWCIEMSTDNVVLISEYYMPEDKFKCIWFKEHYTSMGSGVNKGNDLSKIEKLFIIN